MSNGAFLVESWPMRGQKKETLCSSEELALSEAAEILRISKHPVALQIVRKGWLGKRIVHFSDDEIFNRSGLQKQQVGAVIPAVYSR